MSCLYCIASAEIKSGLATDSSKRLLVDNWLIESRNVILSDRGNSKMHKMLIILNALEFHISISVLATSNFLL